MSETLYRYYQRELVFIRQMAQEFAESLAEKYAEKTGIKASLYLSAATAGASPAR